VNTDSTSTYYAKFEYIQYNMIYFINAGGEFGWTTDHGKSPTCFIVNRNGKTLYSVTEIECVFVLYSGTPRMSANVD